MKTSEIGVRLGGCAEQVRCEVRFSGRELSEPSAESLADTLAAFANSKGGVCLLDLSQAGENARISREKRDQAAEDFARRVCLKLIVPKLSAVIEKHFGCAKHVLRIAVDPSLRVHLSPGGYLERAYGSNRRMTPNRLAWLFDSRKSARLIRFDVQPVPEATLDDLDPELFERFFRKSDQDSRKAWTYIDLQQRALACPDYDGILRPTVAGALMGSKDPSRWLPGAFIEAKAYQGKSAQESALLEAQKICGPVDRQVWEACRFVERQMRNMRLCSFSISAVFEALTNAAAHRDYSLSSVPIRLTLFEDRLELFSPGALAGSMTAESLAYRSAVRNEALVSQLADCEVPYSWLRAVSGQRTLMERRGGGVGIIIEESERLSGKQPVFHQDGDQGLTVTIFAA